MKDASEPNRGSAHGLGFVAIVLAAVQLVACQEQRVEYHYRPGYVDDSSTPKEVMLPNGTKVIFVDRPLGQSSIEEGGGGRAPTISNQPKLGPDGKPIPVKIFEARETLEDGTVILRNIMPDHVVANTMTCFRNEEYRIMWDQLLAPETREKWEKSGGFEAFDKWCHANRKSTMELLNRMRFNAVGSDVAMKQIGPGVMRATLSPHLWDQFQLRVVEFEQTPDGMKLLSIRPAP